MADGDGMTQPHVTIPSRHPFLSDDPAPESPALLAIDAAEAADRALEKGDAFSARALVNTATLLSTLAEVAQVLADHHGLPVRTVQRILLSWEQHRPASR